MSKQEPRFQLKGPGAPPAAGEAAPGPDAFVRGAEPPPERPHASPRGSVTKNFSLRIEPPLQDKIDYVFERSTYKSKQQMVVALLTRALDTVPIHDR